MCIVVPDLEDKAEILDQEGNKIQYKELGYTETNLERGGQTKGREPRRKPRR
jgi:hypothetical protein